MNPELTPADHTDKPVLRRLLELHLHDLSPFTGDEINPDGQFHYRFLDFYWREDNREPFFIQVGERPVGFVLVRLGVPGLLDPSLPANHIAEFFILRKYRRQGIGTAAAVQTFERFPGTWEVAQVAGHRPALIFWRTVIGAYTNGNYKEAFLEHPEWNGTVQRFKTPG